MGYTYSVVDAWEVLPVLETPHPSVILVLRWLPEIPQSAELSKHRAYLCHLIQCIGSQLGADDLAQYGVPLLQVLLAESFGTFGLIYISDLMRLATACTTPSNHAPE